MNDDAGVQHNIVRRAMTWTAGSLQPTRPIERRPHLTGRGSRGLRKRDDRTFINSWEDSRVVAAVKKTGRKKLVIAALWSEMCLAQPAIHAMGEGYDVYVVNRRLRRCLAGSTTWRSVASWLQEPNRSPGLACTENFSVIGAHRETRHGRTRSV